MVDQSTQPGDPMGDRAETVAEFSRGQEPLVRRVALFLQHYPSVVPLIVLMVSFGVFAALEPDRFLTPDSLSTVLRQVSIVGIVGCAQALVILTAGIDLSVGAIMVLSSMTMGLLSSRYGLPTELALLLGLLIGGVIGFINGVLVAIVRLPPFITTLGMWQIVLATNYIFSRNETIGRRELRVTEENQIFDYGEEPLLRFFRSFVEIPGDESDPIRIVSYAVVFMIVLTLALAYVLRQTAWGRHVYAVGDDPEAAELSGVKVKRTLISVYTIAGLICAFGGWVAIGRIGSIAPTTAEDLNIQTITAVVIGGISLFGGRGAIFGMLWGALIVGVFEIGLPLLGAQPQAKLLLIGALIILAVTVDQWIRKLSA